MVYAGAYEGKKKGRQGKLILLCKPNLENETLHSMGPNRSFYVMHLCLSIKYALFCGKEGPGEGGRVAEATDPASVAGTASTRESASPMI